MKIQTSRQFFAALAFRRRSRALRASLAACLLFGGVLSSLRAVDGTWAVDAAGTWSNTANWVGGVVADGAASTANFTFDITAARTVTNDTPRTIGSIVFDDTGSTLGDSLWTLAGANTNPITLSGTGGFVNIVTNSTLAYANEFVISALLTGTDALIFNSTTATTSSQRDMAVTNVLNAYTGQTTVRNGFLNVGGASILQAGSPLGIGTSAILLGDPGTVSSGGSPNVGLDVFANGAALQNYTIDRNIDSSTEADVSGRTDVRYNNNTAAANGTLTISSNWVLGTNTTRAFGIVAQQPGMTVNFTGNITGTTTTTPIRINDFGNGNGTIRLAGVNTFGGALILEEGALIIGGNAPLTSGALGNNAAFQLASNGVTSLNSAVTPATLSGTTDGAYTVAKAVTLNTSAPTSGGVANLQQAYSWTLGGSSANTSSFTGNVNTGGIPYSRTLNLTQVAGGTTSFTGIIGANTDATNVTTVEKVGAGTVILTGANTFDGDTRITNGTLLVNNTTGSGTGIGAVNVGVVSAAQSGVSGSILNSGTGTFVTRQINNINLATATGLQVGQTVTGTGITAGAVLQSVAFTAGGTASIVISTPITVAATTGNTYTDLAFGALTTTGTLGGTGILGGTTGATGAVTVNTGSTLSPGDPSVAGGIGTLTIGSTTVNRNTILAGGSTFSIQVGAGTSDRLVMFGNIDLTGTQTLALSGTFDGTTNYLIATFTGTRTDVFENVTGLPGNYQVTYNANNITLTAVPEPGTWAMLATGVVAFGFLQHRRSRRGQATV